MAIIPTACALYCSVTLSLINQIIDEGAASPPDLDRSVFHEIIILYALLLLKVAFFVVLDRVLFIGPYKAITGARYVNKTSQK